MKGEIKSSFTKNEHADIGAY